LPHAKSICAAVPFGQKLPVFPNLSANRRREIHLEPANESLPTAWGWPGADLTLTFRPVPQFLHVVRIDIENVDAR
jgi:hypothetical protein